MGNKVAVIYSNVTVGDAIAKFFTREGAKISSAGRRIAKLKIIADKVSSGDGTVVFVASGEGSAISGAILYLTAGMVG